MSDGKGRAFPTPENAFEGMNLRTWLAGLAMEGFIAADKEYDLTYESLAETAVRQADNLIAELNKPKKP